MLLSIERFHEYTCCRLTSSCHKLWKSINCLMVAMLIMWFQGSLTHKEASLSLLVNFSTMFLDPQVPSNKSPSIPSFYDGNRNFSNVTFSIMIALLLNCLSAWDSLHRTTFQNGQSMHSSEGYISISNIIVLQLTDLLIIKKFSKHHL